MCGIAGIISNRIIKNSYYEQKNYMKNLMFNRGPDHQDAMNYKDANSDLRFFHSRLSIIDINRRSNQPYKFKNYVLIFNGEIYNYKEIKKKLIYKGYKFITSSDTEVLLKAYSHWGKNCVKYFDGMWAFAIFDKNKKEVFISRDNFGEKPLFYYFDEKEFIFGSEVKYLKYLCSNPKILKINPKKIYEYLYQGYKSINKDNHCFFKNIYKIESGTNLVVNIDSLKIKKIFFLNKKNIIKNKVSDNIHENIEEVKLKLTESLKIRLRSDVPIAFCLSGGVDSSALVSLSSKLFNIQPTCFSIIDEDSRYNESKNILLTKKDTSCKTEFIPLKKQKDFIFFDELEKLINYHDSPISTISYYVHSKISQKAKASGFKVILSGTGADELFTGYYDHSILFLNEIKKNKSYLNEVKSWKKYTLPNIRNSFLKNFKLFSNNSNFRDHIYSSKSFEKNFLKNYSLPEFFETKYTSNLLKNRLLNELFHESVPVILAEDDLNSMQCSIENRSPFLSKNLVNYCLSIKNSNYIKNGMTKYILRQAVKGILNNSVRQDRKKRGFNSNINSVTKLSSNKLNNFLSESKELSEFIDLKEISKIKFSNFISNSDSKFIFSLINLKIFLEKNTI